MSKNSEQPLENPLDEIYEQAMDESALSLEANSQVVQGAQEASSTKPNRRAVVAGLGGLGVGIAGSLSLTQAQKAKEEAEAQAAPAALSTATLGFYGDRQAGIDTPPQAHGTFIGIDLNEGIEAEGIERLLRILTTDAADLTQGQAPLVDQEAENAQVPANLTITLGFGQRIFDIVNPAKKPSWLKPLPAFKQIDKLEEKWSDGDLLLQLCADDRFTLAHAQRMLLKDIRSFGRVRWVQEGFRRAYGSTKNGQTQRNLFGQVDGTINPSTADGSMERFVWGNYDQLEPWEPGGTSLVIRRIHMNLDTWDQADRSAREDAIGRKLSNGAPLTGSEERDPANLSATNELGFTVIAPYAHLRRATAQTAVESILRRPYNYDLAVSDASGFSEHGQVEGGVSNSGLIFCAYQADPVKQFLPIQERLAELDMLNTWTTPIGSAVFALPAGCAEGGFIGESLFSS